MKSLICRNADLLFRSNKFFSSKNKHVSFFDSEDHKQNPQLYNYFQAKLDKFSKQHNPNGGAYDADFKTGSMIYHSREQNLFMDGVHPTEVKSAEKLFKKFTDYRAYQRQNIQMESEDFDIVINKWSVPSYLHPVKKGRFHLEKVNEGHEAFMKSQPRFELKYSVNRQEHRDYLNLFAEVRKRDEQAIEAQKKKIKFIKENPNDSRARQAAANLKLVVPIDKLPDYNVNIEGYELPKKNKKLRVANNDLTDYTAWRCFDREFSWMGPDSVCESIKISLSPSELIRAFGPPSDENTDTKATGTYFFEDSNFDVFIIYDYKQTTEYHGHNLDDEEYENQQHLKPVFRSKRWPTYPEFWASKEKYEFIITFSQYADKKKFKNWVRLEVARYRESAVSKEEELVKKFGDFDVYDDFKKVRPNRTYDQLAIAWKPQFFHEKDEKVEFKREELETEEYVPRDNLEYFDYDTWQRQKKMEEKKVADDDKRNLNKKLKAI